LKRILIAACAALALCSCEAPPTTSSAWPILEGLPAWDEPAPGRNSLEAAWGDMNGDGYLDLALGAEFGSIYVYESSFGTLPPIPSWASPEAGWAQSLAWGDMDGDGDLDLAAGYYDSSPVRIYENDDGLFLWNTLPLTGLTWSVAWADFDGDGDLDLAASSDTVASVVFENDGDGPTTTALWVAPQVDGVWDLAAADWDNDGDVDLATATGDGAGSSRIYQTGAALLELHTSVPGNDFASLAWGDVDDSGTLDLLVGRRLNGNRLYLSEPTAMDSAADWTAVGSGEALAAALVDASGNGRLDAFFGEFDGTTDYHPNNGALFDSAGASPSFAGVINSVAWADTNNDGSQDAMFALGDDSTGVDVLHLGDAMGFSVGPTAPSSSAGPTAIATGDIDGDGDLDLAVSGATGVVVWTMEDGAPVSAATLSTASTADVSFGDFDADGDLDLAAATAPPTLHENTGGSFSLLTTFNTALTANAVHWIDIEHDGDLDLYVANTSTDQLFLNDEAVLPADPYFTSTNPSYTNAVAAADFDGDGDLDLALVGENLSIAHNVNGSFTAISPSTVPLSAPGESMAIGDFDGDDWLDIALSAGSEVTVFYGDAGVFSQSSNETFAVGGPVKNLEAGSWGHDDVWQLLIGPDVDAAPEARLWRRVSTNLWEEAWSVAVPFHGPVSPWADLDGDGDLDFAQDNGSTLEVFNHPRIRAPDLPNNPTYAVLHPPVSVPRGGQQGAPTVGTLVPLVVTLFDAESDSAPVIRLEYRKTGLTPWQTASIVTGLTEDLEASPGGVDHSIGWGSGLDNVEGDAIELRATVVYQSPRKVAFPIRHGALASAPIGPLRVYLGCVGTVDQDGDGYDCQDDCDDLDPDFHPGALDPCADGVDWDCSGEDGPDADEDGYHDIDCGGTDCVDSDATVNTEATVEACDGYDTNCDGVLPADEEDTDSDGFMECAGDCGPTDSDIYLGATEQCNGEDDDCDGLLPADEADADNDSWSLCEGDCNDNVDAMYPGKPEVCDGQDNDCDSALPADEVDQDGDGVIVCMNDCDDANADVYDLAPEVCDGLDNDCDGAPLLDEVDGDGDGYVPCDDLVPPLVSTLLPDDCNDADPGVNPGAVEGCDLVDTDCSGTIPDNEKDNDGDGVATCEGDCDDADSGQFPGNPELCDQADQDCDGFVDEDLDIDADGDGHFASGSCTSGDDCDDTDSSTYEGAVELCDFLDNDCDGIENPDEADRDLDGWVECSPWVGNADGVDGGGDCLDLNDAVFPGAEEGCDGLDSNCDGVVPAEEADNDGDLFRPCSDDCDDGLTSVHPGAAEICDGEDNDCDGELGDTEADADGDGWLACAEGENEDCDDSDAMINPAVVTDECDGRDNDCDGFVDEHDDSDGDGWSWCTEPTDCDESRAEISPDAVETCDGVDEDCDGQVDEGLADCGPSDFPAPGLYVTCSQGAGGGGLLLLPLIAPLLRRRRRP
jgi:hypothetical protein